MHKLTYTLLLPGLLFSLSLNGQGENGPGKDKARQKVFKVLSGQERNVPDKIGPDLRSGAWEAIVYLDYTDTAEIEDLKQAVPDYYQFTEKKLRLKLINPDDKSKYRKQLKAPYRIDGSKIYVYNPKTGMEEDTWEIIYLDSYYLALDMKDLRLFFTHTAIQE